MDVVLTAQPYDSEALYRLFRGAMEPHVVAARGEPWNDEREHAQLLAICGLVIAAWKSRRRAGSTLLAGSTGLLLLSWVGLLWVTANRERTLWTSIPFLLLAAWVLLRRGRVAS